MNKDYGLEHFFQRCIVVTQSLELFDCPSPHDIFDAVSLEWRYGQDAIEIVRKRETRFYNQPFVDDPLPASEYWNVLISSWMYQWGMRRMCCTFGGKK